MVPSSTQSNLLAFQINEFSSVIPGQVFLQCVQSLGKKIAVNKGSTEIKLTAPGVENCQHSVSPHRALPDSSKPS